MRIGEASMYWRSMTQGVDDECANGFVCQRAGHVRLPGLLVAHRGARDVCGSGRRRRDSREELICVLVLY